MARADTVFARHVVDTVGLRDLVPAMGVGDETIRSDVAAFTQYPAGERAALDERRVVFGAECASIEAKVLAVDAV